MTLSKRTRKACVKALSHDEKNSEMQIAFLETLRKMKIPEDEIQSMVYDADKKRNKTAVRLIKKLRHNLKGENARCIMKII